MKIRKLEQDLTICKVADAAGIDMAAELYFIGKTDEELSLVCGTESVPANAIARDDGWKGFRIEGPLDLSLVGVLSKLSAVLAEQGIGIFAVSTFDTDYVLVKKENFGRALGALSGAGYTVL